jgi:glycosyltransferase involved in cell wall biosynthesis
LLRETIENGGWSQSISMCGRVAPEDLPTALSGSRIGLVTREPSDLAAHMFPLKVPEYWAGGLGVVGTDIGEIGRILREGPCGRAVAYDPAAIAAAIRELSDSMTLAGMAHTREAARHYAWSAMLPCLEQIAYPGTAGQDAD